MSKVYWQQRQKDALYNKRLGIAEKQLAKEYKRCFTDISDELKALYNEILLSAGNETLLISDLYKFNHYYEMMNQLETNLKKLGMKEISITEETLKVMYLTNSQLIGEQIGYYLPVNEGDVKQALNVIWCPDGKHWSDRVWSNKALLAERVKAGLVDCIARGASKDELVKQVKATMNVGFNEADRIARTELNYIQNKSTFDKYEQAGIEEYKFLAEIDGRTSDICKEHDGKVYRLEDARVGENWPPLHPNCRSTTLAIIK